MPEETSSPSSKVEASTSEKRVGKIWHGGIPRPNRRSTDIKSTEALISEREKTHGSYSDNAAVYKRLRVVLLDTVIDQHNCPMELHFTPDHAYALDMICVKLARILTGNADVAEHWNDIAGYATLAAKSCQR